MLPAAGEPTCLLVEKETACLLPYYSRLGGFVHGEFAVADMMAAARWGSGSEGREDLGFIHGQWPADPLDLREGRSSPSQLLAQCQHD